jgi:general secretion pathway protein G
LAISRCVRVTSLQGPLRAFSTLELLVALCAVTVLAAVAIPSYRAYVERAKVSAAVAGILTIADSINRYIALNNTPPPDLAAIGKDTTLDPWGRPYVYLSFTGLKGKGQMRKDKNLVPINTQYDLYSVGPDGQSRPPLTAAVSRDDVIMANDGNYVGLASDY